MLALRKVRCVRRIDENKAKFAYDSEILFHDDTCVCANSYGAGLANCTPRTWWITQVWNRLGDQHRRASGNRRAQAHYDADVQRAEENAWKDDTRRQKHFAYAWRTQQGRHITKED